MPDFTNTIEKQSDTALRRAEVAARRKAYRAVPENREKEAVRKRAYRAVPANRERERESHRAWLKAHEKETGEYTRAYNEANADRIAARRKTYREANSVRITTRLRNYRAANVERLRAYDKARYHENQESVKARSNARWAGMVWTPVNYLASLARMKGGGGHDRRGSGLSGADLLSLWEKQGGLCALSGLPMTMVRGQGKVATNASVDRVDNAKGYSLDNIRLVTYQINTIRSRMSDAEFLALCQAIVATMTRGVSHSGHG